ncbi:MAG: helicase-related protein, partial [FCB group bacterium]|nr:helicase-related protein [FCB group bacterium]
TQKSRPTLKGIETVILDEIHAVVDSKRGTHLITAIERLTALAGDFQRIGLSATVKPLEAVANFIGGYEQVGSGEEAAYTPRPVTPVRSEAQKSLELHVRAPARGVRDAIWRDMARECGEIIRSNRSTLVFTNSRRLCERMCMFINEEAGERVAYAHHGSLSRETRLEVEQRFKRGDLKAIVATNSLELGIDIGSLDEVVLIGAPVSVASAIQRVGRAGHGVGETSRGTLLPVHGMDYVHAAVLARAVRERDVEPMLPVSAPLDVLAQVIVSMTAVETWDINALYDALRASEPYHHLRRNHFDLVLEMLAGRYADARVRFLDPLVSVDRIDGTVRAKEMALLRLYSSGGTIPDRGYFTLRRLDTHARIGELDEEFVWERAAGDTFTLGAQSWQIRQITHNDVFVAPSPVGTTFVPFWRADQAEQRYHFAHRVAEFLEQANDRLHDDAFVTELEREHAMSPPAAAELLQYLRRQRVHTETDLPHRHHLLVEQCVDYIGGAEGRQYFIHTLWGGSLNRPYAIALTQAWEDAFGERAEVRLNDTGVLVTAATACTAEEVLALVTSTNLEALLRKRLEQTGYFGARFRENAARALLLPRQGFGKRTPLWLSRLRSKRLFDVVMNRPDFPILIETWRTCLQDEFDLVSLKERLNEVHDGLRVTECITPEPSPFASSLMWEQTNALVYMDDTPEGARASNLGDELIREVMGSAELRPRIPVSVAETFQRKIQRLLPGYAPSSPEEWLDWSKERLFIPMQEWQALFPRDEEVLQGVAHKLVRVRASRGTLDGIVALEELSRFVTALSMGDRPGLILEDLEGTQVDVPPGAAEDEEAPELVDWLAEWLRFYGPVTRDYVMEALDLTPEVLTETLEALVEDSLVLVGSLLEGSDAIEVCDAENFERLLRMARAQRRPSFEALPVDALPLFLAQRQGLTRRGNALEALQDALELLFAYPLAVERVETDVLPARTNPYLPAMLDSLLQESELIWFGCGERQIAFGLSESLELFRDSPESDPEAGTLLPEPRGRYAFSELLKQSEQSSGELTRQLWQRVWRGEIANDSFAAVRRGVEHRFQAAEVQPARSRRASLQRWKAARPFAGNWYALDSDNTVDILEQDDLYRDRVRLLMRRYGVLFRELLAEEQTGFRWSTLFRTLRLMELSGEIVSGSFFQGVPGLQFVEPATVRQLQHPLDEDAVFWMNADDPASLCGTDLDELRSLLPKRLSGTHLVFRGRKVVLISRRNGKELEFQVPPDDPDVPE